MENQPTKIILHHTEASSPLPQFNAINDWHRQREFTKSSLNYFVGYHYVIEKTGQIKKAREDTEIGCHTSGENLSSIGICLVGNFDIEDPTTEQIEALKPLLLTLCKQYNITTQNIFPHRHFTNKSCFGKRLDNTWGQLVYISAQIDDLAKKLST